MATLSSKIAPAGVQTQGAVLDDLNTTGANSADGEILVGTGAGALAWESGATARTSLGLAIGTDVVAQAGDPIGQQTIWIPAGAMTARTTTGAESGSAETTTNKVMLQSLDFDTSADEHAQFAIQMPKGWDESTLVAQCVWSHPSTATNFGVVFFLQAVAFANDDAGDTAFGTAVSMTDTGGTTDDIYISPESGAITVAGSPGAEEYVIFQVYRDVSDASDDLAVDARLHGIKIHYAIDAGNDS